MESPLGLDFEDSPRLRLVVKAETVTSTTFMAVNLILQDINDNLPRFQLQNYVAYMREAQGYETPIIQVIFFACTPPPPGSTHRVSFCLHPPLREYLLGLILLQPRPI